MKLLKKQPQAEVSAKPEISLADQIKQTCAAADQYIRDHVAKIKATDGAPLPVTWIEQNVRATTRGGGCSCKVALALLEKQNAQ